MKKALIAVICSLAVIGGGFALSTNLQEPDRAYVAPVVKQIEAKPPTRSELLKLVNKERAKHGIAPLKIDKRLNWSAQKKSDDMLAYGYYDHESPKSPNSEGNSDQWILASGVRCIAAGENLDENSTASAAVKAWIASKSHHTAMIDSKYTSTGFGIAGKDPNGYYLITEHFCQAP